MDLRIRGGSDSKDFIHNAGDQVRTLGWEDPLEKGTVTHSSTLAWRIPWTELRRATGKELDMTEQLTLLTLLLLKNQRGKVLILFFIYISILKMFTKAQYLKMWG